MASQIDTLSSFSSVPNLDVAKRQIRVVGIVVVGSDRIHVDVVNLQILQRHVIRVVRETNRDRALR